MSLIIDLTTQIAVPNVAKIFISNFLPNDDLALATMTLTFRTGNATDALIGSVVGFTVRNGISDQIERQAAPGVSLNVEDLARYVIKTTRTTTTGYTDMIDAWRAGASIGARGTALKAHLLSAGHIGSTLTGT